MAKEIKSGEDTLAIIFNRDTELKKGHNFLTEPKENLQIGVINEEKGHSVKPHVHYPVERKIYGTQEMLYVEKGRLKVIFFSDSGEKVCEEILNPGELVILLRGGHGFEFLDDARIIYSKQGPYIDKETDKKLFDIN